MAGSKYSKYWGHDRLLIEGLLKNVPLFGGFFQQPSIPSICMSEFSFEKQYECLSRGVTESTSRIKFTDLANSDCAAGGLAVGWIG
jgi:hypothetical protein